MAKFGEQFIASLTRPSFGQGLFTAGQTAGQALAQAPGMRQQRAIQDKQKAEAIKVAMGRGQANIAKGIQTGAITPETYFASLMQTRFDQELKDAQDPTIKTGTEVLLRDTEGNLFTSVVRYQDGKPTRLMIPQPGQVAKSPVGKVTVVSSTTGAGAFDKPGIAAATTRETEFQERRVNAITQLPNLQNTRDNLTQAMGILQQERLRPGGFTAQAARGLASFLGKEPQTLGEFETLLGNVVLQKLENFKGSISEGERQFLIELVGSYRQSGESNIGRLTAILRDVERQISDSLNVATAENFDSYLSSLLPTPPEQEDATDQDVSFVPSSDRKDALEALKNGQVTLEELQEMYSNE
jgi:hypothetical protein